MKKAISVISPDLSKIRRLKPEYLYEGEVGINPAFMNVEDIPKNWHLPSNHKRIWALRADKNDTGLHRLVTGVKNCSSYIDDIDKKSVVTNFSDVEPSGCNLHKTIPKNDKYGHPSLVIASKSNKNRKVIYAGWICQRVTDDDRFLEVCLISGRYGRFKEDLKLEQITLIERHLSYRFMRAYGKQRVIFLPILSSGQYRQHFLKEFLSDKKTSVNNFREYLPKDFDFEVLADCSLQLDNKNDEKRSNSTREVNNKHHVRECVEQKKSNKNTLEQQRLEQQRLEQQRLEQQRLEQQRLKQQRLKQQRLKQQRLKQQRLEQQRLEQQRLEQQCRIRKFQKLCDNYIMTIMDKYSEDCKKLLSKDYPDLYRLAISTETKKSLEIELKNKIHHRDSKCQVHLASINDLCGINDILSKQANSIDSIRHINYIISNILNALNALITTILTLGLNRAIYKRYTFTPLYLECKPMKAGESINSIFNNQNTALSNAQHELSNNAADNGSYTRCYQRT